MASDNKNKTETQSAGKASRVATEALTYVGIVAAILVLANVAVYFVGGRARVDLTSARLFSLSQGSKRLVSDLEDRMVVTAYFTEDLPPPFNATERYVRDLLSEYEAASNGRLRVVFVNPDTDEKKEEANRAGVQEVQHQVIENDSVNVRSGFRGISIAYLGETQTIPVVQDTRGLEYAISQAIRQLVRPPLRVGVVQGHEGPTPTKGLGTLRASLPTYELTEVDVNQEIDRELGAILIVGPESRFSETELRRIDQYLMRGGALGVFGGSMKIELEGQAPTAEPNDTGLNELLSGWGMRLEENLVADARAGRVPMRTQLGLPIPVLYPPAPIVVFDEDQQEHPVLFRLNQAPFFFSSSISTTDRFTELGGVVLGRSSNDGSWLMTGSRIDLSPRDPREWRMSGSSGPHAMMVALEGELPSAFAGREGGDIDSPSVSESPARVLVVGTSSVVRDEFLPSREQSRGQLTGGLAFALNAIDWLTQDADLIAIRAKNIEDPALDVPGRVQEAEAEALAAAEEGDRDEATRALERRREAVEAWDARKARYRWFITLGLPLLVALVGIGRWRFRISKRASIVEDYRSRRARSGGSGGSKSGERPSRSADARRRREED